MNFLGILGIDPRVWQQAQEDNPDVNTMIPTSLVGVEALKSRLDWQEVITIIWVREAYKDA
jgi:hypothetical protein